MGPRATRAGPSTTTGRPRLAGLRRGARRTNLGLLVGLVTALVTGGLAFAAGTGWGRPVVVAHGLAGLAVLVLAPWKSVIVRRGLARRSGAGRWTSVAFGLLVLAAVAAGLGHATGALAHLGPVSAMQVHVGAALAAVPLLAWHAAARGGARPRRTDLSRRALLRAGVVAGGAGLLWLAVERATRLAALPGARRRFTGSLPVTGQADSRATPAPGPVDAARIPVTQWLDDRVQVLDPAAWRLRVAAGDTTRDWTYAELEGFGDQVEAVLDCTGGWFAPAAWEGVRLDRLLPPGAAGSVVVASATGYRRRLPLDDAGTLLLATRLAGRPLSAGHGFPARLVAPGRRGFWWVKWVVSVELDPAPWWRQPPFPLT
jgi:DMSO/TMAO reductase YedYZ molybdopterin-dependent catalytic subunit